MTIGVYGLVAGIVKLDDLGLALSRRAGRAAQAVGRGLLALAPRLMKALSVLGTAAMFLVGGGILVHGLPVLHHAIEHLTAPLAGWLQTLGGISAEGLVGMVAGALVLLAVSGVQRLRRAAVG
jgi:predicted DNA repair protein MutK